MSIALTTIADLASLPFDEVIDVRSPAEWAEDRMPGAVNLPVLDDAERAEIGTIYVRESRFRARRLGAARVARNAARHLEGHLATKPSDYRPLVYCWRGGQRSGAFASVLAQIGWRVETVEGGYRSWRKLVATALYETGVAPPVVILDGNTGTAKTELLALLARRGVQTVDLEGLANHRGSLFGHRPGGQPSQKGFESALAVKLAGLDPARPVLMEAESSKIGAINLPPRLWEAMRAARRIRVAAPLDARGAYLARAYADVTADPARLADVLRRLRHQQPAERIAGWQALADAGDFEPLAVRLMAEHYDPRYARQRARHPRAETVLETASLGPAALDELADRLAEAVTAP